MGAKLVIGSIAGAVGAVVGNPAEVALIRMTADGRLPPKLRRNYNNVFNALVSYCKLCAYVSGPSSTYVMNNSIAVESAMARIAKEEGVLTLWRGVDATVMRAMVVNAAQLASYTQARESLKNLLGDGIGLHFCASMISGFVTSAASLPVDIVKTRVQNAEKATGPLTVLKNVIAKEGVLTLWSGFWPTYFKIGPHTVLTFIIMEQLNKLYYFVAT